MHEASETRERGRERPATGGKHPAGTIWPSVEAQERPGMFRRVHRAERDLLERHLLRLGPEDRFLRFSGVIDDAGIADYCRRLDWLHDIVLGYWVGEDLRAIGELKPFGDVWFGAGEVALSVEEAWRNQDIGTELIERLSTIARNRLMTSLHLLSHPNNTRMLQLARKLDLDLRFEPSEIDARRPLGSPNQLTVMLEFLDEASSFFGEIRRHQRIDANASAYRWF